MKKYDIIIVGGGISGLNTAYQYFKLHPKKTILIIDRNNRLGGRIFTYNHEYKNKKYSFEAGAGRISSKHINLINLIKEFNLELIKIPNKVNYKFIGSDDISDNHNKFIEYNKKYPTFDYIIIDIKKRLKKKPKLFKDNIKNYTLLELVDILYSKKNKTSKKKTNRTSKKKTNRTSKKKTNRTLKPFKMSEYIEKTYHYWSECAVLNAEDALKTFSQDFNLKTQYYVLKGGLSQLVDKIVKKIKTTSNCDIKLNCPLTSITKNTIHKPNDIGYNNQTYIINNKFESDVVVLALPKQSLTKLINSNSLITPVKKYLNMVDCQPLYRIYAQYPINSHDNKVWFHDIGKTTTNLEIKYIIPIDSSKGIIMISYTDGKYANYWNNLVKKSNSIFKKELSQQLKLLFTLKKIPNPNWVTHHYWKNGACYWKPKYSGSEFEKKIIQPIKNEKIFIVNSNFNRKQAWIEGGLKSSLLAIKKI